MAKLVDARDSKSRGSDTVSVRIRPSAPIFLDEVSMFDSSCVFCKIIQGHIPAQVVKENDHVVAIKDRSPKAPVHLLLIPKIHIINVATMEDVHAEYAWYMLQMARDISKDLCQGRGFNLVMNNGADAGQSVFHLHMHFLSGKSITDGGFLL
ncbi:MAG: Histidine triad (HIT) protein [candidate division TM6 bacterium GW2011_GWF2_38_10]|nr:MAG: Histidine triad (HIT) protein [candidate division TM6 bacterium GW2011_GWF2_38_10]